jgi:hypothetical protein
MDAARRESDSFSCLFKEKHREEIPTGDFPSGETLFVQPMKRLCGPVPLEHRAGRFPGII